MKQQFPIFKTKTKGVSRSFDLSRPKEQKEYLESKAGKEIEKIREYLKENTFIAHLLGKKCSGKGTYSKLFRDIIDPKRIAHLSIGDVVRDIHEQMKDSRKKKELINWLSDNYRGYITIEQAIKALESRSTKTLLPTEFILALVKKEISQMQKRALFIDGFPRDLDQISYSLFFRDLIDYREDPDVFVLIDVPETVINERIQHRVICPCCKSPKNLKLHPIEKVKYDKSKKTFYFICDKPECKNIRMVSKEGDKLGIKPIRKRIDLDEKLIEQAFSLYGIPKVLLRNAVPVEKAKDLIDDYEITYEYSYKFDKKTENIKIIKKPWIVQDKEGIDSFCLLPQAMTVSLIKQMVEILNL
jgi:adenylate kinase family enzyme